MLEVKTKFLIAKTPSLRAERNEGVAIQIKENQF